MSFKRRLGASLAALVTGALVTGCTALGLNATPSTGQTATQVAAGTANITVAQAASANAQPQTVDASYDEASATTIALNGSNATVAGDGATASDGTVSITAPGTYLLSGELTGQVVVDSAADGAVKIVLNGAAITSTTGAAIAITDADQAVVVLADGTTNSLTDAESYDDASEDAPNAALFSMADLTIAGNGALSVTGQSADGIASKDGLVMLAGDVTVKAADDGVRGKDYVNVSGGSLSVDAGGDAVKSDNDTDADSGYVSVSGGAIELTAGGDGIAATTDVIVGGGTVSVVSGGGAGAQLAADASAKGIKAGSNVVLGEGTITIDSADDAVHSDSVVSITGAKVGVSSGDDGVHAETSLGISEGEVTVTRSNEGLESNVIEVSGGTTEVTSSDDALNVSAADTATTSQQGPGDGAAVDGHVTVSGGTLTLHAQGDGFDSNGDASITGGTVIVDGPSGNGNGALDVNGTFTISGGTLVAVGSAGMAEAPDADSSQGWVSAAVSGTAGSTITIRSGSEVVAQFTSVKDFGSVVYSSDKIVTGQSYTVTVADQSTTVTAGQHISGGQGGPSGR